jgi:hypothetical protein
MGALSIFQSKVAKIEDIIATLNGTQIQSNDADEVRTVLSRLDRSINNIRNEIEVDMDDVRSRYKIKKQRFWVWQAQERKRQQRRIILAVEEKTWEHERLIGRIEYCQQQIIKLTREVEPLTRSREDMVYFVASAMQLDREQAILRAFGVK